MSFFFFFWKIKTATLPHVVFCLLIHGLLKETLEIQRVCAFVLSFIRIGVAREIVFYFGDGHGGEDS